MNKTDDKPIPRHGYITELAKLCNCSRKTVSRALFEGYTGPKADKVIEMYRTKYAENIKYGVS
jgi:hypothetical protein